MAMEQAVTFACGHDQVVFLVSTSLAREGTVAVLRRSLCPTCQRIARYEAAYRRAQRAGLLPLRAASHRQVALAEEIRASLWELLCPCMAERPCCQPLTALFNRHTRASFWLALRSWPLYRLNSALIEHLFLKLLQPQSCGTGEMTEGWSS